MSSRLFYITRNGSNVIANFNTGLPHNDSNATTLIELSCNVQYVYLAELLARNLRETMNSAIEATRREAYQQGWKDAKARKPKKTWFSSELRRD